MTETYSFPWMNQGQPFDFGPSRVTPHAARASTAHRNMVLKERLKDLDMNGLPPLAVQALVEGAKEEAALAQGEAMLYWALVQVDAKVKDMKQEDVMQKFDLPTYMTMVDTLNDRKGKTPLARGPPAPPKTP